MNPSTEMPLRVPPILNSPGSRSMAVPPTTTATSLQSSGDAAGAVLTRTTMPATVAVSAPPTETLPLRPSA